jgi:hypothetical protein
LNIARAGLRDVTYFPSRPANGESFTLNIIVSVGGSISGRLQRLRVHRLADAVADVYRFEPDQRDDVARFGSARLFASESVEHLHLLHGS